MSAPDDLATPEQEGPPGRTAATSPVELAFYATLAIAALISLAAWGTRTRVERPLEVATAKRAVTGYVGEASCRSCHPGESALYQRSGHARTLRPAAERGELARWLDGKKCRDPEFPEATFRYHFGGGKLSVERSAPGSDVRLPIEFAFGSGEHATTFVTMTDRDPAHPSGIEHRLTHYRLDDRLDITPGQDSASVLDPHLQTTSGRILDTAMARKCFDCHSTRLSDRGPETLDLETLIPNVSCERCHGPGEAHVTAARRGDTDLKMAFGPGQSTPFQLMRLCGQCHRLPDKAAPGVIRPDNVELVRFQPVGLMASKCYQASGGAIGCMTCHDPHARVAKEAVSYEKACITCHGQASQPVCKVSPATGCIDCHMPRRDAGQRVLFTDHWIRIHPEQGRKPPHGPISGAAPAR